MTAQSKSIGKQVDVPEPCALVDARTASELSSFTSCRPPIGFFYMCIMMLMILRGEFRVRMFLNGVHDRLLPYLLWVM